MAALNIDVNNRRYEAMIGVGGVGSGKFFMLNGNHTIGREESRSGSFINRKDYCKLHIIAHYVQTLLGRDFKVIPLGMVGNDDTGHNLITEMSEAGLTTNYLQQSPGSQTLFSFCFIYPDGSGGNLTTDDSACSKVDASFIEKAENEFEQFVGKGIALAAPEVSLEARNRLLEMGTDYNFLRIASFTSEEMQEILQSDILTRTDLLAINFDEAAAAVEISIDTNDPSEIIEAAVKKFGSINDKMHISITKGKDGSWSWNGSSLNIAPVHKVPVESTAGAGDAHLAGLIAGFVAGLSLQDAQHLAALVGSLSVTSPHTINKEIDRESLRSLADDSTEVIKKNVYNLLEK